MKTINPKNLDIRRGLPPVLPKDARCAIDTEWFGMDKNRLHRPHGTFACATFCTDDRTVYVVTDVDDLEQAFQNIDLAVHIYVNAKFDITQLRKYIQIPARKRLWDCFLIEQIMYSGYYNDFSLADLARRRLDLYLPKEIRDSFSKIAPEPSGGHLGLSQEQLEYAAVDTVATWMVYQDQRAEIDENDLAIWKDIELPFLWTLLDVFGMPIDKNAWTDLYTKNKADADSIQRSYMEWDKTKYAMEEAIKKKKYTGINLGSNAQVGQEIIRLGYSLPKTKTGKPSTVEDDIAPFASECKFVRDVLEYRGKIKLASTYGVSWITNGWIESDGCVYSDFHQIGAATGRLSSSKPNVENIPVRETSDFRKCFVALLGFVLIDADWSAQEPRIATYLSGDEQMLKIFQEHRDVYIESARLMFGWELDKKDERRKTRMKPTVLGASYGLTEHGMEKKYGVPKEEGKELLETFFNTFEGMREWKKRQQQSKDYVTTIYGRKYWLNLYAQGSENNALNSPVQGSGGDAIKIAGSRFQNEIYAADLGKDIFIINFIHDEILVMCRENMKDWTMETLKRVMVEVAEDMHEGIPAEVEAHWGHTWHDAHG